MNQIKAKIAEIRALSQFSVGSIANRPDTQALVQVHHQELPALLDSLEMMVDAMLKCHMESGSVRLHPTNCYHCHGTIEQVKERLGIK